MNLELLNTDAYKDRPITSKVLKKYIESDEKNIWIDRVNGLIYDPAIVAKMTETDHSKPYLSLQEDCCLFSSAHEGDFVLLKNPTKVLGDTDDWAYSYDEDTQCRYYLAQSTSDKGLWKMIRVGRTELKTKKSYAEELALTRLDQQETVTLDSTDYMLMPMPGINLTTLWQEGIPFQNPLQMFKLAHFALATLGTWLKRNLVHTSLSADYIEQTDSSVQFTGYKHVIVATPADDASVVFNELSAVRHPWLSPKILTYKNLNGAFENPTTTTVTINGRDMCYALINNIVYMCTGAYPERTDRLVLLKNSGYQEVMGKKIDSESVVGPLAAIPLCPFYKQNRFVHFILELEEFYWGKKSSIEIAQSMNTIVGVHRLEAMELFDKINPKAAENPADCLNVWEAQFESDLNNFLTVGDSSTEVGPGVFDQTKILCFFLSDARFLNESWLQRYIKEKGISIEYVGKVLDMVSSWRRGEYETVALIWNKAFFELKHKAQTNLLQTLISWRQPGINSRISRRDDPSVLHAVVNAFISAPNDQALILIYSLLKAGANPYLGNKDNWLPLMDIAAFGSIKAALLFMEAGVYSCFRDSNRGWSAFHYAANRVEHSATPAIHMLQILQQMGCIDTADNEGITPLMLLQQKKSMMPVLYAIEHMGARMDLRDSAGKTLMDRGFDASFLELFGPEDYPGFRLDISKELADLQTQLKANPVSSAASQLVKKRQIGKGLLSMPSQYPFYEPNLVDNHFELLRLLQELPPISSFHPSTFATESSEFPGYDIVSNTDHQLGWNCFDVAVGFRRDDLVKYALDNKDNIEYRNLLAVEIRHAMAWTAVHPTAIASDAASDALSYVSRLSKKTDKVRGADFLLPSSLWTLEIREVFNQYANVYEKPEVRAALKFCNDEMAQGDGKRLNWEQLGKLFNEPANRRLYPVAFTCYNVTVSDYIAPVCMAMDALCRRPDIYETYVTDYYGKKQWFAFNAQFQGEHSTSMIDIAAKMLSTKIVLHSARDGKQYSTSAYGASEIHVGYNGYNHFYGLISKPPTEVVRPALGDLSIMGGGGSSSSGRLFMSLRSSAYSEKTLVLLLAQEVSFCTLAIKKNTVEGLKAALFDLIISRAEQGISANANVMVPYQMSPNVWVLICLQYKQHALDELESVYYFDPLGADIDLSLQAVLEEVAMPAKVLTAMRSVPKWDTGPWVVEAAKSIVKSKMLPEMLDTTAVRRKHLSALEAEETECMGLTRV